jgi:hypothetical protein
LHSAMTDGFLSTGHHVVTERGRHVNTDWSAH